jgi:uncharacterized protein
MIFQEKTKTKKSLFITVISTYGIVENMHSVGFVQQEITMDNLF